jgi:hypothetical protein
MEFVAITVSNNDELRSHYFGTNIGEDFYHKYNILNEAIIPFRCFSILKRKGKDYCEFCFCYLHLTNKFSFG